MALSMKVISTDAVAPLPAQSGQAELLNSSLENYSEMTLCARFLTYHFSTHWDGFPYQALISSGSNALLGSYVAKSCEQRFKANLSLGALAVIIET